jgi:hypothetical protein
MVCASPRSICAPADPAAPNAEAAELQSCGGGLGALADQIEREIAVFGLRVVVEHLKPIDDGANRADEIVTDSRTQQCREFEEHREQDRETKCQTSWVPGKPPGRKVLAGSYESRVLIGLIHCAAPCCQRGAAMVRQDEQQIGPSS